MYTNIATGEDIYRLNFAGTTGILDVRAADCIDLSIRMALAEYDGIPPLPPGDTPTSPENVLEGSAAENHHETGSDSGSDAFSDDFLAKCGIYLGEKLYKPKKTARCEGGNFEVAATTGTVGTSSPTHSLRESQQRQPSLGVGFSSPVRAICQL